MRRAGLLSSDSAFCVLRSRFIRGNLISADASSSPSSPADAYSSSQRAGEAMSHVRTFLALLFPADASDEGDELGAPAILDLRARADACHAGQPLVSLRSDGDDQLSAPSKLLQQRIGHRGRGRAHDDAIEG